MADSCQVHAQRDRGAAALALASEILSNPRASFSVKSDAKNKTALPGMEYALRNSHAATHIRVRSRRLTFHLPVG